MVIKVPDEDGKIIAYCEFRQVAQSGFDKLGGEYIWINDLWVHPDYRNKGLIKQMIDTILYKAPDALYCYFKRSKYNGRMRLWKRENFERLVKQLEIA